MTGKELHDRLSLAGKKGGSARVKKGTGTLSPQERSRRMSEASKARWAKKRKDKNVITDK